MSWFTKRGCEVSTEREWNSRSREESWAGPEGEEERGGQLSEKELPVRMAFRDWGVRYSITGVEVDGGEVKAGVDRNARVEESTAYGELAGGAVGAGREGGRGPGSFAEGAGAGCRRKR
jgi:hypothetical protein